MLIDSPGGGGYGDPGDGTGTWSSDVRQGFVSEQAALRPTVEGAGGDMLLAAWSGG